MEEMAEIYSLVMARSRLDWRTPDKEIRRASLSIIYFRMPSGFIVSLYLHSFYNLIFGALPGTLLVFFCNFVHIIDIVFILGDGLTRLLLRWEKSAPFLSCFWITTGGMPGGIRTWGAAEQQPGALTTYLRRTMLSHAAPCLATPHPDLASTHRNFATPHPSRVDVSFCCSRSQILFKYWHKKVIKKRPEFCVPYHL